MAILDHAREISVTDAARRGVARLVTDAEDGEDFVVTRRREPVAVVVSIHRLAELDRVESDLRDLALVLARAVADTGRRVPVDDVLAAFGHTRESLAELPDED
jgi:prevent-host-death family protein